jgi:hypothetical protein
MAYNAVSGTLIAPQNYLPGDLVVQNVVSGNLSTSDGAGVINVPRVSNATNNSILTNVGGDANTLTCESNLTFDGATLNITGDLTASVGVSASFFYGDGSKLTNLPGGGGGSGGGIFTTINSSNAFTTSSINIGSEATPTHTFSVKGGSFMSGGVSYKRKEVTTATYTVSTTDYYLGVDSLNSTIALTLPNAGACSEGQTFIIKDEGGNADNNAITISAAGVQTIDGVNSVVLESPYAALQLYCNGVNKFFVY